MGFILSLGKKYAQDCTGEQKDKDRSGNSICCFIPSSYVNTEPIVFVTANTYLHATRLATSVYNGPSKGYLVG